MGGAPSHFSASDEHRWGWQYKVNPYWCPPCDFPQNTLSFLQDHLSTSPSNMVYALIEDNLSALTLIEYILDYIRFIFIEPSDFVNIDFEEMTEMHKDIAMVDDMLRSTPFYDEEQSRRVEAAYQDIFSAMKQSTRLQTDEAAPADASSQNSSWLTFIHLKNCFPSDTERNFMTRLRQLYVMSRTLTASEIFQNLCDICQSANPEQIMLSDVSINTAMRTAISIISTATEKLCSSTDLTERRFNIVESFFDKMHKSPILENRFADSRCCLFIMTTRSVVLHGILARARVTCQRGLFKSSSNVKPVKVEQPNQHQALSPFWKKLQIVESLNEILRFSEQACCAICREEDIRPINFAILDKCLHVYCVGCIQSWFETSNICPYCRLRTINWTTRDDFLAFKRQSSTAAQTNQANISSTA